MALIMTPTAFGNAPLAEVEITFGASPAMITELGETSDSLGAYVAGDAGRYWFGVAGGAISTLECIDISVGRERSKYDVF